MHTFQLGERRSTTSTTVYLHRFVFALFFFFCLTFNKWTLLILVEGEEDGSSSVMQWLRDLKQKFLHDEEEEEEKDEEDIKEEDLTFEAVDFLQNINSPKRWEVLRASPEEFTFAHTEVLLSLL